MANFVLAAIAGAIAVPAGWAAAQVVRRLAGSEGALVTALIVAFFTVAIWATLVMPSGYLLAVAIVLGWTLCVLSATDLLVLRLPDVFTFPLIVAGLLLSAWLPDHDVIGHAIGAAAGFLALYAVAFLYRRLRAQEGLGLGDAKLVAAAGAWLGWQALPSVLLIACLAAFAWIGVAIAVRGRSAADQQIAFGVPLCVAFWLVWLYGAPF